MIQETEAGRVAPPSSLWRILCGWAFMAVGILGLILPILPGVPLLFAGLILLSSNYQWAQKCLQWLKTRVENLPTNVIGRIRSGKHTVRPTP